MRSLDRLSPSELEPLGCPNGNICPLNSIRAGGAARIRLLIAEETLSQRLRELGFCEDRTVRLIHSQASVVCLVCNARLAISAELAEQILVEPLTFPQAA